MKIDRAVFLATATALWTAGCPSDPGLAPPVLGAIDIRGRGEELARDAALDRGADAGVLAEAGAKERGSTAADADAGGGGGGGGSSDPGGACDADMVGTLAVCNQWRIDPTCESSGEQLRECRTLYEKGGYGGLKPRVAQAAAECWAQTPMRSPACKANKGRCIRNAVDTACVEPEMRQKCDDLLAECRRRGKRIRYTREQCEKILSATVGQARQDAITALSPMNEGCVLDFVLPYYPYNRQAWP